MAEKKKQNDKRKAARAKSWKAGQARKEANRLAQSERERANRQFVKDSGVLFPGGDTMRPSEQARFVRRAIARQQAQLGGQA